MVICNTGQISKVSIIYILLFTMYIVSKQLYAGGNRGERRTWNTGVGYAGAINCRYMERR